MRKIKIVCMVILCIVISGISLVYGETITKTIQVTYRNISILVNDKIVPSEQEPFIYQGRTFAPLRTIGEAVNKTVEWDNANNQIIISDPVINVVRLGSYIEVMNYFPDHYQYTKSDEKLSPNEINKIEVFLKILNIPISKMNIDNPVKSSFLLKNKNEEITVFNINMEYGLLCIRYSDGSLYFINPANEFRNICGSSDGWIVQINSYSNVMRDEPSLRENFYMDYLAKIDYSLIKDSPNRTKQITDLYTISLWINRMELD
jgi:hypothetical protein